MKKYKLIFALFLLFSIPFVVIAIDVYQFSQRDEARPADAAIVLGAGVIRERPSPVLRERINHAIQLYEDGYVDYIIFTGGIGNRDTLSEAEVSRDYAVAQGVPIEAILLDTTSTNTRENLANAKLVAEEKQLDSFLIVSTPFHMKRAILIAQEMGINAYTSPTRTIQWINWVTKSYAFLREVIAYGAYLLGTGDSATRVATRLN